MSNPTPPVPRWICATCQPSEPAPCQASRSTDARTASSSINGRLLRAAMNVPQYPTSAYISRLLRSAVQGGFAGSDGHAVGDDLTGR